MGSDPHRGQRILVGMSGGVDSAYCAMKLLRMGYSVEGAFLIMHSDSELKYAEATAHDLGIPLHVLDCRELFDKTVKRNFALEYSCGRTPNPCVICNEQVKLRRLYDHARSLGIDRIATGHYARVTLLPNGRYTVAVADDLSKDQSYMLSRLPQDILSSLVLPMWDEHKRDVRREAAEKRLCSADRPDSMEICFIEEGKYTDYLESVLGPSAEGDFVDGEGRVLGRHKGIIHYTVGQRKGLGISLGARAFVRAIDPQTNRVELCLTTAGVERIELQRPVLLGYEPSDDGSTFAATVKLRYSAAMLPCRVTVTRLDGDYGVEITLDSPTPFVTPGQSAVVYSEGAVLLSGFINQ